MSKRKIAIFTGNRAEYGLQYPILRAIDAHPDLEYTLIVSGAHLDPHFGETRQEIADDGFHIDEEIVIEMGETSRLATAVAIGTGMLSISKAFEKIKPDIVVVYADRFEGFAAVIAASQMSIPTAHIEGGDVTEGGALDDSVRHAMSKLAHLHFTTNEQAANRVKGMGEEAWRVHNVGFPAIDLIEEGRFATPKKVQDALELDFSRPVVLFTQHSVTTEFASAGAQVAPVLEAMADLAADGVQIILTYPNNDVGGRTIIASVEAFAAKGLPNVQVRRSLGRSLYHGVLALARDSAVRVACVGNSSSGIKETPAFGCPTVNIGSRQQGRLRAENVIDAGYDRTEVAEAARRCLFDDDFRDSCRTADNPYFQGGAGKNIARLLAEVPIDQKLIRKRMTLQGVEKDGWFQ